MDKAIAASSGWFNSPDQVVNSAVLPIRTRENSPALPSPIPAAVAARQLNPKKTRDSRDEKRLPDNQPAGHGKHNAPVLEQGRDLDAQTDGDEKNGEEKVLDRRHVRKDAVLVHALADRQPGNERPEHHTQTHQRSEKGHGHAQSGHRQGEKLAAFGHGHGVQHVRNNKTRQQDGDSDKSQTLAHRTQQRWSEFLGAGTGSDQGRKQDKKKYNKDVLENRDAQGQSCP
jgi:hypothetical protein